MGGVPQARLRRLAGGAAAGVLVGVVVALLAFLRPLLLEPAEHSSYDVRARKAASAAASTEIVFIDVSEDDIANAEKNWGVTWPWPRAMWGYLAGYVHDGGARTAVLDWVFHDRGQYSVADAEEFADAISGAGNVVIGLALHSGSDLAQSDGGTWGLKLAVIESRGEAEKSALRLMAWDVRSFLVGDGPTTIYIGGYRSPEATAAMWERIANQPELTDDLGKYDPAAEPPQPIELDASILGAPFSIRDVLAARDGIDPGALDAKFPAFDGLYEPLAVIGNAPARMGVVTQSRDQDGVMRRHAPFFRHRDRLYPSLAMAALLTAHPNTDLEADGDQLRVGARTLRLDDDGRFVIRFDQKGRYKHIPAYEVLRSIALIDEEKPPAVDPAVFKDKYVIVSAVAVSLRDSHSSPVSQLHPGAEIQANALENLIAGASVRRASPTLDALTVFAVSVISALVVMFVWGAVRRVELALIGTFAVSVGLGVLWWQFASWLLEARSQWVAVVYPLLGIGGASFAAVLTASASERRGKRFVQEALGRYTSPALVAELTEHPEHLSLEWGEVRQMSVYFSDIAGFTSISEALEPRQLVALLNEYLTSMTDIILSHDGVVDKYIGDAIMAFWGAPIADPDHAVKAVRCALAMRKRCEELQPEWIERFGQRVFARAGVNSGEAVVGNMGSAHKYNYTVMGDMVNLAARLESANKPYGSALMISEYTLGMLEGEISVRELDLIAVKGKEQPVRVYEVLDLTGKEDETTQQTVALFTEAFEHYRERDFSRALSDFERVLEFNPDDGPSKLYVERCQHFISDPPADDWDGVWRMKTK